MRTSPSGSSSNSCGSPTLWIESEHTKTRCGAAMRLKVRSLVGLLPLCASTVLEPTGIVAKSPRFRELVETFKKRHPELLKHIAPADEKFVGYGGRRLMSVCNKEKIARILVYMLDESEFFGPYGMRSLSKHHLEH